jgi:hypothetical protein
VSFIDGGDDGAAAIVDEVNDDSMALQWSAPVGARGFKPSVGELWACAQGTAEEGSVAVLIESMEMVAQARVVGLMASDSVNCLVKLLCRHGR